MTANKVTSVGRFLDCVQDVRENLWRLGDEKQLWFRGESQDHKNTLLRPELYRPREPNALRPVDDLLDIESALYEEFQRCSRGRAASATAHRRARRGGAVMNPETFKREWRQARICIRVASAAAATAPRPAARRRP
jgi:hypothetical protein